MAEDIARAIRGYLLEVAGWRERTSIDYPEDGRNSRAAEGLRDAAEEVLMQWKRDPEYPVVVKVAEANDGYEADPFLMFVPTRDGVGWDASQFRFNDSGESIGAFLTRFADACLTERREWDKEAFDEIVGHDTETEE